ncbi:MAG: iron-sulfur cluster-binding domain-containing protein [Oleiphilaceae bacterium]|nr:iron-sulfur cluster-binding domain-containing protein [Oleiphilaceae bacterium]
MKLLANTLTNTDSYGAFFEPLVQLIKPHFRSDLTSAKVTSVSLNDNFMTIELKVSARRFRFKAGQHIQLYILRDGRYISRCFSPASSPQQLKQRRTITLGMRINPKGQMTSWLAKHLKVGDYLSLGPASGDFVLDTTERRRVFVAGGSGITPILAMLESLGEAELRSSTLLYSTRNTNPLPFQNTMNRLKARGLTLVLHNSAKEGRISKQHLDTLNLNQKCALYVCGPSGMITLCEDYWQSHQLAPNHLHFESFGGTSKLNAQVEGDLPQSATIHFANSQRQGIWLNAARTPLLDFAEQQGLTPSFGCRIGVCHQCTCKKQSGRVINLKTGEVSDSGPESIQLCQSLPLEDLTLDL